MRTMANDARGSHTVAEISTQGESWQGGLRAAEAVPDEGVTGLARAAQAGVLLMGCGSTYYLAQCLAPWATEVLGAAARAVPASELALGQVWTLAPGARPLVVALSRSGATSETVMAVRVARERGCRVAVVTCYPESELAAAADVTVVLPEGQERSFAQTRSFAGMLVAAQMLVARMAGVAPTPDPSPGRREVAPTPDPSPGRREVAPTPDPSPKDWGRGEVVTPGRGAAAGLIEELRRLPELVGPAVAAANELAQRWADAGWDRVSYLGSGWRYGLAGEAMIKMKEMALATAEAFHVMEFRHGPMALVDERHLVVALLSEAMGRYEEGVLADLCQRGAQVVALGPSEPVYADEYAAWLQVGAGLSELARLVLYLPFLQFLAYHRAMAAGQDPDRPRNVVMAIRLEGTAMAGTSRKEGA
jgi:glucosamine--fructose-6-phosphate aminotransferase (isomerizing)